MVLTENEKFQNLVLEHLARITQEITEIKSDLKEFKQETDSRFDRMESTIWPIREQTAGLTEFKTEIISRLDSITEVQTSLLEMYGEHEAEIRALRRRPV